MAIAGGFIGGGVNMVPAGYGQVFLQWQTEDRLNVDGAVFTLTGTGGTFTANGDASGRTEIIIPVGEYDVSIVHQGIYDNDSPQKLIVESTQSYLVLFYARMPGQGVMITGPATNAQYQISNASGKVLFSGTGMGSSEIFALDPGEYTISISLYGDSSSKQFSVIGTSVTNLDISDLYCKININNKSGFTIASLTYNTFSVSPSNLYVVRTDSSRAIKGTITESYSNMSTSKVSTIPSQNVIPNKTELDYNLNFVGTILTLTENGSLYVPVSGTYHVLVIGGGARGNSNNGGGSGEVSDKTVYISKGNHTITIGSGGTKDSPNGGATSFGSVLSASGGSGINGGSGGGAKGSRGGITNGGNGSYGGGGGSGSDVFSNTQYHPGTGGTYGGDGGAGAGSISTDGTYSSPQAGKSGTGKTDGFYSTVSTSYSGGFAGSKKGGGGGGGGLNAKGGDGGAGTSISSNIDSHAGGGGGGGIDGGTGGKGGDYGGKGGSGGYGYGAGGGGSRYDSNSGGGGGGGGLSSTKLATNGSSTSSDNGEGAKGAVRIQWVSQ